MGRKDKIAGKRKEGYDVLPLLRKAKKVYPEDANILFVLKYHMVSVVDSIDATIQVFEQEMSLPFTAACPCCHCEERAV